MSDGRPPSQVHVKRLVVDAGALHGESVDVLRAQLSAAVRQALGDTSVHTPAGPLAAQVGAAVRTTIDGRLVSNG